MGNTDSKNKSSGRTRRYDDFVEKNLTLERFIVAVEVDMRSKEQQRRSRRRLRRDEARDRRDRLILQVMRDRGVRRYWINALAELATKSHSSTKLALILQGVFPRMRNHRMVAERLLDEAKSLVAREAAKNLEEHVYVIDEEEVMIHRNYNRPPPPASPGVIASLPTMSHNPNRNNDNNTGCCCGDDFCNICQDHYGADAVVKQLPCGHTFHATCIDSWLNRHRTCPLCRQELPTKTNDHAPTNINKHTVLYWDRDGAYDN